MDRISVMHSFARVVETGSFSAVAKEENTGQGTISKRVAALEADLGARLLIRGSRSHTLTEAGQIYYQRVINILQEIEEADSEVRCSAAAPKGRLCVTVPTMFGGLYVAPYMVEFLTLYPEIKLDLKFSEGMSDLVGEGIDVAIRIGELADSSMIAKHLTSDPLILVAAPSYLADKPVPRETEDLQQHNCLTYTLTPRSNIWSFSSKGSHASVQVNGNFSCDSAGGLTEMVLKGAGIAFIPHWHVAAHLQTGALVQVMEDHYRHLPINAVFPQNRYVPLRTRCFVDFMEGKIKKIPIFNRR